ncbi:hypothetical protein B0A54_17830 [Friedmanniomyces endolithicus]|uniref:Uncharacterized protein n=3 Tax=Friedmanniomyces endolithicus TaxID=329885 RepID=A0A4U0TPL2_9PEZI|nr:hypothetical protein B0A54_17830 [Friedmanniomyces endolithicus]
MRNRLIVRRDCCKMDRHDGEPVPLACVSSNRLSPPDGNDHKMHRSAATIATPQPSSKQSSRPPSSRRSRGQRPGLQQRDQGVPETDPTATAGLWTIVLTRRSMAQRGAISRRGATKSGLPVRSAYTVSDADSAAESSGSRARALRPQQYSAFRNSILAPRHITIDADAWVTRGPSAHFGTSVPEDYRSVKGLEAAGVLLDLQQGQEKEIAAQYSFMKSMQLCEAEFATYATETFFLGEPRSTAPSKDRLWRAERMLQLVCPPSGSQWLQPPLLELDVVRSDDYSWDVRPDCAYWISTRGFNDDYAFNVKGACFVYEGWILWPYLTIEFKRYNEDLLAAQTQAVTAGAMALYNRYKLYTRANPGVTGDDTGLSNLAHYAITFTGPSYIVWKLSPNDARGPNGWNGCCMRNVSDGNCTREADIKRLVEWVNEIHRWGLTAHAHACQMDVKRVLNQEDVDTSAIE